LRDEVAEELERGKVPFLSTARRDRAAFLVGAGDEEEVLTLARRVVEAEPMARVGVGRPAQGRGLGRSLLEARAALDAGSGEIASYQDLGSLELLLSLPDAALDAFVDRVLGEAADSSWLMESLAALLESGCRWTEAADRLGVHRHTLRYRIGKIEKLTGRSPTEARDRLELWLALRAHELRGRRELEPVP
jgi:purine catabolism regulator